MGTATASSSKGLWGGFAKQLWVGVCVRGGVGAIIQHEGGSFQHLLSVSHHALLQQDISFLYSDSRVDEKEEL